GQVEGAVTDRDGQVAGGVGREALDELDDADDLFDELVVDAARVEGLGQREQAHAVAGEVGEDRAAGGHGVDDRLQRIGEALDVAEEGLQDLGDVGAHVEPDVVEADGQRVVVTRGERVGVAGAADGPVPVEVEVGDQLGQT